MDFFIIEFDISVCGGDDLEEIIKGDAQFRKTSWANPTLIAQELSC